MSCLFGTAHAVHYCNYSLSIDTVTSREARPLHLVELWSREAICPSPNEKHKPSVQTYIRTVFNYRNRSRWSSLASSVRSENWLRIWQWNWRLWLRRPVWTVIGDVERWFVGTWAWAVPWARVCVQFFFVVSSSAANWASLAARLVRPTSNSLTERPEFRPPSQPDQNVVGAEMTSMRCICYLTANTHYGSGALIPKCNDLSQQSSHLYLSENLIL